MTDAPLDLAFARSQFPGLHRGWVLFDNAGGSQTVSGAVDRIAEFLLERDVQIGGSYAISLAAAEALQAGREAARDLMNAARPEEIVFGPSTTQLMMTLAAAMRGQFEPGDEIVLCQADHESNIGPWERLEEFGVRIRFWPVDAKTQAIRLEDLEPVMGPRTKLVCIHHVSNILGEINDIAEIARFVHARGARICVDGVAYAPHRAIDVRGWDVDYYVFSLYKTYGPHTAILYGRYDLLRDLDGQYHYFYGKEKTPGKLEPGNPNYELAFATTGVTDYLEEIGRRAGGTGGRRALIEAAFTAIARQENALTDRLLGWLATRDDIEVIGSARNESGRRVPTIAFRISGLGSGEVASAMDAHGIAIRFGDFHSRRLIEALDEDHDEGVVRVSLVHYNTVEEVDLLIAALSEIAARRAA